MLTEHDGIVIFGRSDAVLNPGGVRIGTAEIYRQVEQLPEVVESIAVGQDWDNDVRVILFVRLRDGQTLDDALTSAHQEADPRQHHAAACSVEGPRRCPTFRARFRGKIVELAVREVIHGRPVKNTDALANPQALEAFRNRKELES